MVDTQHEYPHDPEEPGDSLCELTTKANFWDALLEILGDNAEDYAQKVEKLVQLYYEQQGQQYSV